MEDKDLSVYDFNEHDDLTHNSNPYFNRSNPNFNRDIDISNRDFPQHEQVHVLANNDDDRCIPQDSLVEVASKQSMVFGAMPDGISQLSCQLSGDTVKPKSPSLNMDVRFSSQFGLSPENGHMTHTSPFVPESPCSNGSVGTGASDGCDNSQESSPSTSGSEQEDSAGPFDGLAYDQPFSGLDMEEIDCSLLTDYVNYGDKYIPACVIVFSDTSLRIETAESEASMFVWNIDDIHGIESHWFSKAFTAKVKVHVVTKDVVQEEIGQGAAGVGLLEFCVHDPQWLQRQELIVSLNNKYRAIWNIALNGEVCKGGPFALEDNEFSDPYIPRFEEPFDELVYPKGGTNSISISKTDVDLLEPDVFLNDTIIEFYFKYLENEIPSSERGRFYFFNSFFFTKLADPEKNTSGVFDGKAGFQRVRKWTRKVNIFEKDYIFIPVNYNLHWSLLVICHPGEVAKFNDENVDDSVKVPCVLHMDSIRGSHTGLKDIIQSYLLEEWKEKQKETSEDIVSRFLNLRFLSLELPQQENCTDCGLFLLHYAELFIFEAPKNFNPFRINKFDNFLKPDWFPPAEASLKRVHIQRLIHDLLEDSPLDDSSPSNHESQPIILLKKHENDNGIEVCSGRTSPGKSCNPLHAQCVQGMDVGLLDMSLYSNVSSLGMRDLLECQNFGQVASFGQPGSPTPPFREEVADVGHLTSSNVGQKKLESTDEAAARDCHIGYTPEDSNQGFRWDFGFSDQGTHGEDTSEPCSIHSSDDSEDVMIMEHEHEIESPKYDENRSSDERKGNVDSFTESYVSASSDMMETPPEDSQELAKIYGLNGRMNSYTSNLEEAKEMPAQQEFKEVEDDDVIENVHEVVEDSSTDSDEGHAAKRTRHTPVGDGEKELIESLSKEDGEIIANGNDMVEDSIADSDDGHAAKRMRLTPLGDGERELIKSSSMEDDEIITNGNDVVEDSTDDGHAVKRIRLTPLGDGEMELIKSLSKEDDEGIANGNEVVEGSTADSDDGHTAKRIRLTPLCDGERELIESVSKKDDGAIVKGNEVVEDSGANSDEGNAAKRIQLTPLGDGERELIKKEDDEAIVNGNEVVEDSSADSDEGNAEKKVQLTPLGDGERELVRSLSKEVQV